MEGVCAVIIALMKRPENYFQLLRVIGNLNSGYSSECFIFFFKTYQLEIYLTQLAIWICMDRMNDVLLFNITLLLQKLDNDWILQNSWGTLKSRR